MKNWVIVILVITLAVTCQTIVCGCFGESTYPAYKYTVEIKGLSHYANFNSTELYVPLPVMEGGALYNKSSLGLSDGSWSAEPVKTDHGEMLSLRHRGNNLTDLSVTYNDWILNNRSISQAMKTIEQQMGTPLSPVSTGSPAHYSIYEPEAGDICQPASNYTSYIFVDEGIAALGGENSSLEVILRYDLSGMDSGASRFYKAEVHEQLPAGTTGWVPVTVWVSASK